MPPPRVPPGCRPSPSSTTCVTPAPTTCAPGYAPWCSQDGRPARGGAAQVPPHARRQAARLQTTIGAHEQQLRSRERLMATIELNGLTKRFGTMVAVDHLSFSVPQGSVVGFLGPNGAGKTTTLRMLLGLVNPTEGTATINGLPYRKLREPRHVVGAALEASGAYPGRTARNPLRIEALAADAPSSRVAQVLDLVDLTGAADRRV